ncbi:hypothetical protein ACPV5O_19645 [Vibrio maritimus]|uniref:hypothetical protein n=1 Tax=Vibrio maritimus TaxID=990268 RepID=UPI0040684BBF
MTFNNRHQHIPHDLVVEQLTRIFDSPEFHSKPKHKKLLSYIVHQELFQHGHALKQSTIAIEVFNRPSSFDAKNDTIVRSHARQLRAMLEQYYKRTGQSDPIHISVPRGSYRPELIQVAMNTSNAAENSDIEALNKPHLAPSLAVVPFTPICEEHGVIELLSGMHDNLTTELAKFDMITVIQTFTHPKPDSTHLDIISALTTAAQTTFLLSGSIQPLDDGVRVHAKLHLTATGEQVWAERYTLNLDTGNVFESQDEIVSLISATIGSTFGVIHRELYQRYCQQTIFVSPEYEAALLYRHYLMTLSKERHQCAITALLALDAKGELRNGSLYAMLACLYLDTELLGVSDYDNAVEKGSHYVKLALEFAPRSQFSMIADYQLNRALGEVTDLEQYLDQIVTLNPNSSYLIGLCGWEMCMTGQFSKGLKTIEHARKLNPYFPIWFSIAECVFWLMESDYQRADSLLAQINLEQHYWTHLLRAVIGSYRRNQTEAIKSYQRLLEIEPLFATDAERCIDRFVSDGDMKNKMMSAIRLIQHNYSPKHN